MFPPRLQVGELPKVVWNPLFKVSALLLDDSLFELLSDIPFLRELPWESL